MKFTGIIPEDGSYEALKEVVLKVVPCLPDVWKADLLRRWKESGLFLAVVPLTLAKKMLPVHEPRFYQTERGFYLAYFEGESSDPKSARRIVDEAVKELDGWLFDWNSGQGPEGLIFNFGVAVPAL